MSVSLQTRHVHFGAVNIKTAQVETTEKAGTIVRLQLGVTEDDRDVFRKMIPAYNLDQRKKAQIGRDEWLFTMAVRPGDDVKILPGIDTDAFPQSHPSASTVPKTDAGIRTIIGEVLRQTTRQGLGDVLIDWLVQLV